MISARITKYGDAVIAFTYALLQTHSSRINQSARTIEAARL